MKFRTTDGFGAIHLHTVLLDLGQLCEIDEKQYNMGPFKKKIENKLESLCVTERILIYIA